jgi:hypothetical protein
MSDADRNGPADDARDQPVVPTPGSDELWSGQDPAATSWRAAHEQSAGGTAIAPPPVTPPPAPEEHSTNGGPAAPVRVCRKCAVQSRTFDDRCPNCGSSYLRGLRRFRRRSIRMLVVLVPLLLVLGGAGAAVYLKLDHDADQRAAKREAAEQREQQRERAERQRQADAQAQADADALQADLREDSVRDLENAVKKDAEENVSLGLFTGPITQVQCDPVDGNLDDLSIDNVKFECLAANQENEDGTIEGYRYSSSIDFESGEMRWRVGGG